VVVESVCLFAQHEVSSDGDASNDVLFPVSLTDIDVKPVLLENSDFTW